MLICHSKMGLMPPGTYNSFSRMPKWSKVFKPNRRMNLMGRWLLVCPRLVINYSQVRILFNSLVNNLCRNLSLVPPAMIRRSIYFKGQLERTGLAGRRGHPIGRSKLASTIVVSQICRRQVKMESWYQT